MKQRKSNWLARAILFSFFLHLLLIWGGGYLLSVDFSPFAAEMRSSPPPKPRPPLVFQLTETPEDARIDAPKQPTPYVSDKAARAQDEASDASLPVANPYSNGVSSFLQPSEKPRRQQSAPPEQPASPRDLAEQTSQAPPKQNNFSRRMLRQQFPEQEWQEAAGELVRAPGKNLNSRAPDLGSFSLNTYDWEFAPYMLRLKRRIEKNIFPPPAFIYMGMISGKTYLKFRITKQGVLEVLEVIDYRGHKSLMETSRRAVQISAPFEPLPANFPEKYLEVTARFEYFVQR